MSAPPFRCGRVAILGWTNVGKSTLLNRLVGDKLAAVADAAQTTRFPITGIRHLPGRAQLIVVDTPGLHAPRSRMNRRMVDNAWRALEGVDVPLVLVDAARGLGAGDRELLDRVRGRPSTVVAPNKVDLVRPKARLLPLLAEIDERWGPAAVVPVSASTGDGCEALLDELVARLPEGPPQFDEDEWTDQPLRAMAAEWVREKLVRLTRQELPHSTAVLVERWDERGEGPLRIDARIIVDRESQKPIVIGRGGEMLKRVGSEARAELERLIGRQVALSLWVAVREGWREDERTLREMGIR